MTAQNFQTVPWHGNTSPILNRVMRYHKISLKFCVHLFESCKYDTPEDGFFAETRKVEVKT